MSPYEMDKIKPQFRWACAQLGWSRASVEVPHERDDSTSISDNWYDPAGRFLFSEDNLTLAMAAEILRIATLVRVDKP